MSKILLGDDDQMLIDLYTLKFTKLGHEVTAATDAKTFLEKFQEDKFDFLLIDRRLGEDDGLQLFQQIRAQESGKTVPVIVLTNLDPTAEDMEIVKKYPPAEYLIKEKIDLNELVEKIGKP